ncbi:hypothetical protein [Sinorhizobium fredii]|uniref:hypothetical protein n=1 Tax=Rhizobium fredii TaxID=380 RepID=UPI000B1599D8|nr:hypothetical protein [Sinorhizobium fredii]WOS64679.1 hypothetical protein SFGR64A_03160 [Sinorhizobium fredii GR64]
MTDFYKLVPGAPPGRFDGIERPGSAAVSLAVTGGQSSTTVTKELTEHDQFRPAAE